MHLVFQRSRILLSESGRLHLPGEIPHGARDPHGGILELRRNGTPVRIMAWPEEADPPAGTAFHGLRGALGILAGEEVGLAGHARQLLDWREHHRFCGRCGRETELGPTENVLVCPGCGLPHFPRVSPAVIVLVHDGERILLGRHGGLPGRMYSTLAGFVEPGESAEETVHREILEESGVSVTDLRYFGSQSWPFPHSLMLGFFARHAGGEPRCLDDELDDVRWFTRDHLPELPPSISIARRLIDAYLEDPC